ncbi:MAG: hypothetical protein Q9202_006804 [Teloschistes flavicans]
MDTSAYLTRQGWLGKGNTLHPSGHGIKQPLLVARKTNTLGLGKKAHDVYADQWWSRAFEETLGSLNGSAAIEKNNMEIRVKTSVMGVPGAARWGGPGGLYGGFVRGAGLEGTIGATQATNDVENDSKPLNKRRRLAGLEPSPKDEDERSCFETGDQHQDQKSPPEPSNFILLTSKCRGMKKPSSRHEDSLGSGPPLQRDSKIGKSRIKDGETSERFCPPGNGTHISQSMKGIHEGITEDKPHHQQVAVEYQGSGKSERELHTKNRKRKKASAAILTPGSAMPKGLSDHPVTKRKRKQREKRHE